MKLRLVFGILVLSLGVFASHVSTQRALADIAPCAACVHTGGSGGHGHGH